MLYLTCSILFIQNVIMTVQSNVVRTTLGSVKGKVVDDETTGAYYFSFEGIPYAEPPIGNLRFKPPVPKRAWSNVFDATKPGRVCPQSDIMYPKSIMSEDCLNFNIYTPAKYLNKLKPVIFLIPGGDFAYQSGNAEPVYGPQLFVLFNDIVVVSMNYRLGALGFLSLCTEEVSGNAGIKDVILALKIIHKNIKNFGGDPNKITLVGHGAGSVIAQSVMLTTQANGLYQNAVLHGGSILSAKYFQINPRRNAMLLSRILGINSFNDSFIIKKLQQVNAFDIIKAQEIIDLKDPRRGYRIFRPFKPTVEIECGSAVITKPPSELIRKGAIRDVPILIGFNNQQGLEYFDVLKAEPELIDKLNSNFELCIPEDIKYPFGSKESKALAERIRDFYFDGGNITFVKVQNYINFKSDSHYTFSIYNFIRLFKKRNISPVYYYVFAADTELNWYKADINITYPGAGPFDNIGYLFITAVTIPRYKCLEPSTQKEQATALYNVKYFTYYGAPAPNPNTDCWPETGKDPYPVIQGSDSLGALGKSLHKRIKFWRSVYEEYLTSRWNTGIYGCSNTNNRLG